MDTNGRQVRRVRREGVASPEPEKRSYVGALGGVIEGTIEIDVDPIYKKLNGYLHDEVERAAGAMDKALERAAAMFDEAHKLAAKARRDYELLKEDHESWLEAKRTAARMTLEEEKASNNLKKTITIDMVLDQVRATWPDEYAERNRRIKDLQAAVHRLEAMPEATRIRARALEARMDMLRAQGAMSERR